MCTGVLNVKFIRHLKRYFKGKLKAFIYDKDKVFVKELVSSSGQVALFFGGGHGFEVLEDLEMYEIKQGPFAQSQDKVGSMIDKKELFQ